jgi:hypothetical protein
MAAMGPECIDKYYLIYQFYRYNDIARFGSAGIFLYVHVLNNSNSSL